MTIHDLLVQGYQPNPRYKLQLLGEEDSNKLEIFAELGGESARTTEAVAAAASSAMSFLSINLPLNRHSLVGHLFNTGSISSVADAILPHTRQRVAPQVAGGESGAENHHPRQQDDEITDNDADDEVSGFVAIDRQVISLQVYDSNGRHAFDAISEAFMSSRGLIGLVCDVRNPSANEMVRWLELIAQRAPDCGVVLFCTHADGIRAQELAERINTVRRLFLTAYDALSFRTGQCHGRIFLEQVFCFTSAAVLQLEDGALVSIPKSVRYDLVYLVIVLLSFLLIEVEPIIGSFIAGG